MFVKLFRRSWETGFLFLDSSEKCQSQNPCIPPPHSLVWQRNLIELETFCDTDTGHHFYCTQSPGVGSSNSTVETHLFRAYAKNTTLFLIHNIWTQEKRAKATFVWILSASLMQSTVGERGDYLWQSFIGRIKLVLVVNSILLVLDSWNTKSFRHFYTAAGCWMKRTGAVRLL